MCVRGYAFGALSVWRRPIVSNQILTARLYCDSVAPKTRRGFFGWLQLPASVGIGCLAVLQLWRARKREKRKALDSSDEESSKCWQIILFELLPTRMLSQYWGYLHQKELPTWLRSPLLGLYVKAFGCDMAEAEVEQLAKYRNLCELFTRKLKPGVREICQSYELVSPCDGRVLHCGRVEDGHMEQVKGVCYSLDRFFGPRLPLVDRRNDNHWETDITVDVDDHRLPDRWYKRKQLFHLLVYLGPGDYHHFHSPASWVINHRRHFHGHLITVAPWAAKRMKGFLSENERVMYSGSWSYGFFSLTAVGAYNIGSIKTTMENDLQTNQKSGNHLLGQFSNKRVTKKLEKGDHMGVFNLGSSVVIIFEAPEEFEFDVKPGDRIRCGDALGMKK